MKKNILYLLSIILLAGCIGKGSVVISVRKSFIDPVDSLMYVDFLTGNSPDTIHLFKIAQGGNLELIAQTVVCNQRKEENHVFAIADYFQENQLFYIVFNPQTGSLWESPRLYLPQWGLTDFEDITVTNLTEKTLAIRLKNGSIQTVPLKPLYYDRHKIINNYEYE